MRTLTDLSGGKPRKARTLGEQVVEMARRDELS